MTELTPEDVFVNNAIMRLCDERTDELYKLRISIARLAQTMDLGHMIPKIRCEETGDEAPVDMQKAPYELLRMAAITDRGWNNLVGAMVELWYQRHIHKGGPL